jgi:alpha-tubulin suppressor-like RCC1 family protein
MRPLPRSGFLKAVVFASLLAACGGDRLVAPNRQGDPANTLPGPAGNAAGVALLPGTTTALTTIPSLAVGLGSGHACEVTGTGQAYCWGSNTYGELGDGMTQSRPVRGPVLQPSGVLFTDIATGARHTCARTTTGAVYCWGDNSQQQLGIQSPIPFSATPRLVPLPTAINGLTAGSNHTCVLTASSPVVYCWGSNASYQIGVSGSTGPVGTPTLALGTATPFSGVTAGTEHTCALYNGGAYCWGRNSEGQLGVDPSITGPATPVMQTVQQSGVIFARITAGGSHTCGLERRNTNPAVGNVWCWGSNANGQLGNGGFALRSLVPVLALPAGNAVVFTEVDAGVNHTCGLSSGGEVYCWGFNPAGQVGTGAPTSSIPASVNAPAGLTFTNVAAGNTSSCARSSSGTVYCWGGNGGGQLGDATTTDRPAPTAQVATGTVRGILSSPQRGVFPNAPLFVSPGAAYAPGPVTTDGSGRFNLVRVLTGINVFIGLPNVPAGCTDPGPLILGALTADTVITANIDVTCTAAGTVNGTIIRGGTGNQSLLGVTVGITPAAAGTTATSVGVAGNLTFSGSNVEIGTGTGAGSGTVGVTNLPIGCSLYGPASYTGLVSNGAVSVTLTINCSPGTVVGRITRTGAGTQLLDGSVYTVAPGSPGIAAVSGAVKGMGFREGNVQVGTGAFAGSGSVSLSKLPKGCSQSSYVVYTGLTIGGSVSVTIPVDCSP